MEKSLTWSLQALLMRHESYMAEAEQERLRMAADLARLGKDKHELEVNNAQIIDENRGLLDQLEELNSTVADSDTHIKSLNATLRSTQLELQKLNLLATQTTQLEARLEAMELEQSRLHQTLVSTEENERSAVQRWKRAERTLGDLENQIERIEKETKEERERHVEVVGRMERRKTVEKELESSAGRLKAAAAATTEGRDGNRTSVVSHFVKDILQDNANLQLGIVELREMLESSNGEVQTLRERLFHHQCVLPEKDDLSQPVTLKKELDEEIAKNPSSEVHVHHHYHGLPTPTESLAKDRAQLHRRPKKKRNVITLGLFTSPSGSQTPRTSISHATNRTSSSTAAAILSQTSVTIPPTPPSTSHRWSMRSSQTTSSYESTSVSSSPHTSVIFDRLLGEDAIDSSRPTSPESNGPISPPFLARRSKPDSKRSPHSFSALMAFQPKATVLAGPFTTLHPTTEEGEQEETAENIPNLDIAKTSDVIIPEEHEDEDTMNANDPSLPPPEPDINHEGIYASIHHQHPLRRSASHESLLSVSGMELHTLRSRSSQFLNGSKGFSLSTPLGISSPSTALASSKPVLSAMTVTARPPLARRTHDSSHCNRSLLSQSTTASTSSDTKVSTVSGKETLGKRVGGWVWGKWGVTPAASTGSLRAKAALTAAERARAPGVNQSGAVKGLRPPLPKKRVCNPPAVVATSEVDEDLLKETLLG
ncbi:MAG: hypothetical protein M1827_001377 [Pycnora praestabilis]|nr:MAG: hypothetical protein M1827_001377 [Pycnora praestabilis]